MVDFIKTNGDLFSVARNSDDAFYMWRTAKELDHTVRINGVNYGNGWEARYEIEKLFNASYLLNVR